MTKKAARQLVRQSGEIIKTARSVRKGTMRVISLTEARRHEILTGYSDDGIEITDVVALTDAERLSNLRASRIWATRVDNDLRHLIVTLDRSIDLLERSIPE